MFNNAPLSSAFSLSKMVGGINKTLGVVNQIIPIYKETKPMIENAKNAMNLIKEFGNNATNRVQENTDKNIKPIKEKIENLTNNNFNSQNKKGPTFFL